MVTIVVIRPGGVATRFDGYLIATCRELVDSGYRFDVERSGVLVVFNCR